MITSDKGEGSDRGDGSLGTDAPVVKYCLQGVSGLRELSDLIIINSVLFVFLFQSLLSCASRHIQVGERSEKNYISNSSERSLLCFNAMTDDSEQGN